MSDQDIDCAAVLKVLADETRLSVVRSLMAGPKHVGEINEELNVEPTLLSHHLKVLREAELVSSERDGKSVLYRLTAAVESRRKGAGLDLGCCKLVFD